MKKKDTRKPGGRARKTPARRPLREDTSGPPGALPQNDANEASSALYAIVRAIPRGKVITYGELAELAGIHRGHRVAARAMRVCPATLPWHRVIGKKDARRGQIAVHDPEHAATQRKRLASEGVAFDDGGFIVLRIFGWLPRDA